MPFSDFKNSYWLTRYRRKTSKKVPYKTGYNYRTNKDIDTKFQYDEFKIIYKLLCLIKFFHMWDSFRDISVQKALGSGRVGPGRFKPEMGLGGGYKHFLFYTPHVKNASFSRYALVFFPLSLHQALSPCEESLRSASSPRFARLRSQLYNCLHLRHIKLSFLIE